MHPSRTTDQPSHLTSLGTSEADCPPSALFAPENRVKHQSVAPLEPVTKEQIGLDLRRGGICCDWL